MLKKITPDKYSRTDTYISFGGLAGFAAVSTLLLSIAPENILDTKLRVALYCFASSLPMLVLELINTSFEARHQYTVDDPKYITIPVVASVFATSLGTVLLFWHFSKIVGAIFFISFIYCVVAHSRFQDRVLRVNRPER